MVTNLQRQWLGYLLSGLLLVSTSGIPVHKLVCLCKGEQTIQFYAEPEGCCAVDANIAEAGCCSGSSCQAAAVCSTSDHACQDKEVTFLKIVDQFLDSAPVDPPSLCCAFVPAHHFYGQGDLLISDEQVGRIRPARYKHLSPAVPIYRTSCQIRC